MYAPAFTMAERKVSCLGGVHFRVPLTEWRSRYRGASGSSSFTDVRMPLMRSYAPKSCRCFCAQHGDRKSRWCDGGVLTLTRYPCHERLLASSWRCVGSRDKQSKL